MLLCVIRRWKKSDYFIDENNIDFILYKGRLPDLGPLDARHYLIQGMELDLEDIEWEGWSDLRWLDYTERHITKRQKLKKLKVKEDRQEPAR